MLEFFNSKTYRKSTIRKLSIVIVPLVLLLFGEVYLRIFHQADLRTWKDFPYTEDLILGYRYMPKAVGTFRNTAYSNKYYFNSLGFPGPEFLPQKDIGVYRIILIGSSDDVGFNTNGPLNYVNITNKAFKENDDNIEIINCSIDGSGKDLRKIKFIRDEVLSYHPDMILFANQFPFNDRFRYRTSYKGIRIEYNSLDVDLDAAKELIDQNISHRSLLVFIFDHCYLFRAVCKYYFDHKKEEIRIINVLKYFFSSTREKVLLARARSKLFWSVRKGDKPRLKFENIDYSEEESIAALKKLSTDLSGKGVRLVCFDKYASGNADYKETFFKQNNIDYFALNVPYIPIYSFGEKDGHSSQEGHIAIAKALYPKLKGMINSDTTKMTLEPF